MTTLADLTIEHSDGEELAGSVVLRVAGTLGATTYHQLRDAIIKAVLSAPCAVIVDVDAMSYASSSALAVFTSARWHVSQWPDVAIAVAAADDAVRSAFDKVGVARYVPIYPSVAAATAAIDVRCFQYRKRATADLDGVAAVARADAFVDECLQAWGMTCRQHAVRNVARALVENAVAHGRGGRSIRLETDGHVITVAVSDENPTLAMRREQQPGTSREHGLDVVASLSRTWRSAPTGKGKTVWALIDATEAFSQTG